MTTQPSVRNWLTNVGRLAAHRRTRYVVCWLTFLGTAGTMMYYSWTARDIGQRRDGNDGHATIDFGGQWLMGRMVDEGHAGDLYDRDRLRVVLSEHYPDEDCVSGKPTDVENLMYWMMGNDRDEDAHGRHVGGPLYPPVHCFLMAPMALLPPHVAYRFNQILNLIEALAAGCAIRRLFGGRVWLPLASLSVIAYYGYSGSMTLGQNATLTLVILLWGWVFMVEGKETLGGMTWGLLAFKPVWALSFFLVPILTRRWRVCLAMGLTGLTLALLTLPMVGLHSWLDWLKVGREAAALYKTDSNWTNLCRDVLGLPRRWFARFSEQTPWLPDLVGWTMLVGIFLATVALAFRHRRDSRTINGPIPAFILLGAWLCCYRFMYYDVLLSILPVTVLLADTNGWLRLTLVRFRWPRRIAEPWTTLSIIEPEPELADYRGPRLLRSLPIGKDFSWPLPCLWTVNSLPVTIAFMLYLQYPGEVIWHQWFGHSMARVPLDTYSLLALWLWCAVYLLRLPPRREEPQPAEPAAMLAGDLA